MVLGPGGGRSIQRAGAGERNREKQEIRVGRTGRTESLKVGRKIGESLTCCAQVVKDHREDRNKVRGEDSE